MKVENNIKCRNCGADMVFDPQTGKLFCKSCGAKRWFYQDFKKDLKPVYERDIDEIKEKAVGHHWILEEDRAICNNCGGEVSFHVSDNTIVCPYCDSSLVVKDLEKKTLSPDGVVPFRLTEKDARAAFNKRANSKFLCPKEIKRIVKNEKFQGIYLPCWTFDVEAHITCTGSYMDKKKKETFHDEGKKFINDRIAIATDRHEVEYIREVYPFETERNRPYKDEYVAGFESEKYTIAIEKAWKDEKPFLEEELKKQVEREIKINYSSFKNVTIDEIKITYDEPKYKYLLIPVWLSEFEYKGVTYEIVVNGENGKVGGELPVSNRNRNIAVVVAILAALLALRYIKEILVIVLIIILVVVFGVGAFIWGIKREMRK